MNDRTLRICSLLAATASLLALAGPAAVGQTTGADADALRRYRAEQADFRGAFADTGRKRTFVVGKARKMRLSGGDLLAATPKRSAALQMTPRETRARIRRVPLGEAFVPRGIAVDNLSGVVAVAAVSRVLLYDSATGDVSVLAGPEESPFAFVNSVLFDEDGLLIIADQGEVFGAQLPADGRIWAYDRSDGGYEQLGTKRELSNPKHLALDSRGRLVVVDGNSGPRITPLLDEPRYDTVWRLAGVQRQRVRPIFREVGLQATAFAITTDDEMWFGSLADIVILDGNTLRMPCPRPSPLSFVSGIAFDSSGQALIMDGDDADGPRRSVYRVDQACTLTEYVKGRRLHEARGLAIYQPSGD